MSEQESKPLNSMCANCKCLGHTCQGTTNKVWTGCIYRTTK